MTDATYDQTAVILQALKLPEGTDPISSMHRVRTTVEALTVRLQHRIAKGELPPQALGWFRAGTWPKPAKLAAAVHEIDEAARVAREHKQAEMEAREA